MWNHFLAGTLFQEFLHLGLLMANQIWKVISLRFVLHKPALCLIGLLKVY